MNRRLKRLFETFLEISVHDFFINNRIDRILCLITLQSFLKTASSFNCIIYQA